MDHFRFGVLPEDVAQAQQGIAKARELLQQFLPLTPGGGASGGGGGPQPSYDLLILDEINIAVALGMLEERDVETLIDEKPPTTELVLTGRTEISKGATSPPGKPWPDGNERQRWLSYFDRANLVTEMRLVRHYFYEGVPARAWLDY